MAGFRSVPSHYGFWWNPPRRGWPDWFPEHENGSALCKLPVFLVMRSSWTTALTSCLLAFPRPSVHLAHPQDAVWGPVYPSRLPTGTQVTGREPPLSTLSSHRAVLTAVCLLTTPLCPYLVISTWYPTNTWWNVVCLKSNRFSFPPSLVFWASLAHFSIIKSNCISFITFHLSGS